jgi:exoribonuclease R
MGVVSHVVNFGAFVMLESGLEGLIHISELAEGNFMHPANVVAGGPNYPSAHYQLRPSAAPNWFEFTTVGPQLLRQTRLIGTIVKITHM